MFNESEPVDINGTHNELPSPINKAEFGLDLAGRDLATRSNAMFGQCSPDRHDFYALLQFRKDQNKIQELTRMNAKRGTIGDAGDCVPRAETAFTECTRIILRCCPYSEERGLLVTMRTTSVLAMMVAPEDGVWVAVVQPRTRCTRHCIDDEPFLQSNSTQQCEHDDRALPTRDSEGEQLWEMASRREHGCWCEPRCVGRQVCFQAFTQCDYNNRNEMSATVASPKNVPRRC